MAGESSTSSSMSLTSSSVALGLAAGALAGAIGFAIGSRRRASSTGAVPAVLGSTGRNSLLRSDESASAPASAAPESAATKAGFLGIFKRLSAEVVDDLATYGMTGVSGAALQRMLEYNVPHGKLNRGLTVVQTAVAIHGSAAGAATVAREAAVLGWCVEWLQASFLVSDDLMDASVTRRGQPCWYRQPDIGLIAVNDALVLLTHVDVLLHKYFGGDADRFMRLHRILTETTYQTELGQLLDLSTQPPQGPVQLDLYTQERYELIVQYKTAFYSFYAPIALGMVCAGVADDASLAVAREICVEMGTYFQVQDDFLDVYGEPEVLGKVGTDVQDAKCSWLVVQALKKADEGQRQRLLDNYGKEDPACIAAVKVLFDELELPALYHAYEEDVYRRLCDDIRSKVHTVPHDVYFALLHKIYKRDK